MKMRPSDCVGYGLSTVLRRLWRHLE